MAHLEAMCLIDVRASAHCLISLGFGMFLELLTHQISLTVIL